MRVVFVEDSESDAALMVRLLERAGYDVLSERVEDREGMRATLDRQAWDVVISDHRMAEFDSPGALRVLHEAGQDIPFIVVSGSIGEELAVTMMQCGAHDYVLKDNLARLVPAVEREIREARSRRDRRQAEQSLRESEERLALAIESTQLGTFDFFPESGKLIWSERAKGHFGLAANAEVCYDIFLRGLHANDRERIHSIIQGLLKPGSDGQYSAEYRTVGIEDGVERSISSWGRVYFDAAGLPLRFIGVTKDITQRKQLEEQLHQAQKMESIGRLAGGVAHDFNNLLTIISGYAQLTLAQLPPASPQRNAIEEVSNAADRAIGLTRQLLTFSRRGSNGSKEILVNALLTDFEKMLSRLIGENIHLGLSLHPDTGRIWADPGEIERVVMNLVLNARDAMPGGGKVLIEASPYWIDAQLAQTHPPLATGEFVMLSVSDTGAGMTTDVMAHIFEPFFTTKNAGEGTGLGLSTTYGIVAKAGGTIWVSSEPGRGSIFNVLLPAMATRACSDPVQEPRVCPGGKETILLAEDEPGVRRFVREILVQHGYTVIEGSNGRTTLEQAQKHSEPIHLLLTDAVMPGMSGLELSRIFTAERPGVPVLCMSGYKDQAWPDEEFRVSSIQKPFAPADLLMRIRTLLDTN